MKNTIVTLPDLGEGLTEATLRRWHVSANETVKADQPLATVETAKSLVDIPCPEDGLIAKLHVEENQSIAVGKPLVSYAGAEEPSNEVKPETQQPPPYKIHPNAHELAKKISEEELTALSSKHGLITKALLESQSEEPTGQASAILIEHVLIPAGEHAILARFLHALKSSLSNDSGPLQEANIAIAVHDNDRTHIVTPQWPLGIHAIQAMLQQIKTQCREARRIPLEWQQKSHILVSNFGSMAGRYGSPKRPRHCQLAIGIGQLFIENGKHTLPLTLAFDHDELGGREALRILACLKPILES